MILNFLYTHREKIYKKKDLIQMILLASATISLVQKPILTKVTSGNLLCKDLEYPFEIRPMKFVDEFDSIKSPANTILIVCDEEYRNYFDLLYGSIKNLKIPYKEVVLTTSKHKLISKYFTVINLTFGRESCTKIFPIRNTQPNSDLASISKYFFPNKYDFSLSDLIYDRDINFPFRLHIEIEYSRKQVKQFCILLRTLINVEAFTSGKYFYIPFIDTNIHILQLFPFCLLIFLYYFIDWIENYQCGCHTLTLINLAIFYCIPITGLVCLFFKKERMFLVLSYFFLHFRYGFLCSVILYLCALKKSFVFKKALKIKDI